MDKINNFEDSVRGGYSRNIFYTQDQTQMKRTAR